MWTLRTAGAVTEEPVTLTDARRQCRIGPTDTHFDADLTRLIKVARDHVEKVCNVMFAKRSLVLTCTAWNELAALPVAALDAIASITYLNADGNTLPVGDIFGKAGTRFAPAIVLNGGAAWPTDRVPGAIITLSATFGGNTPESVQHAMLMLIAHHFSVRESVNVGNIVTAVPDSLEALISNDKCYMQRIW